MHSDLQIAKEIIYDKCGYTISNLIHNKERLEYGACSFLLNNKKIIFRVAKITPTKVGQFVTIWQRDDNGITQPFNESNNFDFIVINTRFENNVEQFVFPKSALSLNGIITTTIKDGKRDIRVYPPWDIIVNKQATKTQRWQVDYFLPIVPHNLANLALTKKLLLD
jgi:hypothetical protein